MEPQTYEDKLRHEHFIADHQLFIGYAATIYNKVHAKKKPKSHLAKKTNKSKFSLSISCDISSLLTAIISQHYIFHLRC